ncbi:MAG: hypothetical protein K5876_00835 [Ruminiclostridium sp.]|nr:hypothetical protein [Ruminiclostridium sp.]
MNDMIEEAEAAAKEIIDDLVENRRIPVSELLENPNAVADFLNKAVDENGKAQKKDDDS